MPEADKYVQEDREPITYVLPVVDHSCMVQSWTR